MRRTENGNAYIAQGADGYKIQPEKKVNGEMTLVQEQFFELRVSSDGPVTEQKVHRSYVG